MTNPPKLAHRHLTRVAQDWLRIIKPARCTCENLWFSSVEEIRTRARSIVISVVFDSNGGRGRWSRSGGTSDRHFPEMIQQTSGITLHYPKFGQLVHSLTIWQVSNVPNEWAVLSDLLWAYETLCYIVLLILFYTYETIDCWNSISIIKICILRQR